MQYIHRYLSTQNAAATLHPSILFIAIIIPSFQQSSFHPHHTRPAVPSDSIADGEASVEKIKQTSQWRDVYRRIAARPATPAKPATVFRPAAPVYVAIGCLAVASGVCHADHEPVLEAAPVEAATGVLEIVLSEDGEAELHAAHVDDGSTGVLEEVETELHAAQLELGSTGVEELEQDVEVLVQTGTEMVQGQSVTVRVVEAETV